MNIPGISEHQAVLLSDRIRRLLAPMETVPTGVEAGGALSAPIRAIFFDVYGTLFMSGSGDIGTADVVWQADAMRAALEQAGYGGDLDAAATQGAGRYVETIRAAHAAARDRGVAYPEVEIRNVWNDVVRGLVDDGVLELSPQEDAFLVLAVEYEFRTNRVWPMSGLIPVVAGLKERDVPFGVVSNAQFYTPILFHALFRRFPEELGFATGRCAWSYRIGEAKPSQAMFSPVLEEVSRQGIAPVECLYVGNDMLNDVFAASQAGMQTCLFAGDRRSLRLREDDPRCAGTAADVIITQLEQLDALLT